MCVGIGSVCDFEDIYGADVEISKPGYTASGSIGAMGEYACFEDIPPGHYAITVTKEGCGSVESSVDVACGDDAFKFAGAINCSEGSHFEFSVSGCGNPLPGAVCTLSGSNSGVAVTDSEGVARVPVNATGPVSWTVTHPSGRFDDASGTDTVFGLCEPSGMGVAMSPADGYACCFPGLGGFPDNPYPISTSLIWTDCTGEYPFEIDPVGCGQDRCVEIPLDDVSLAGPTTCVTCTGGGTKTFPPTDIGVHPINVLLTLDLGGGAANIVRYFYRTFTSVGVKFLNFKSGAACPDCGANDSSRSWRMNASCEDLESEHGTGGVNWETRASISYVVNSVIPFNLTATINPAGNGYGPGAPFTSWSGSAPCETVVISEAV
jgi:hypothetical protein